MRVPAYNSPHRMIFCNRLLVSLLALWLLSSAYGLSGSPQQTPHPTKWDSPSADLAKQIAVLNGPGTGTLTIVNRSTIPTDELPAIRRALERELRTAGMVLRDRDADCDVRITLSQNLQGYLWVAEVQEGATTKVAMLTVPGASVREAAASMPAITLRTSLLYAQDDPILDLAMIVAGNEQHMIVLEPEHIRAYAPSGASWQLVQTYDIPSHAPLPRDLRGRIVPAPDHLFDAYLPGAVCTSAKAGEGWSMAVTCSNSDDPWPLGSQKGFYNSEKNFFTGVVVPGFGLKLTPFYSAAELVRTGSTAFLFADVNGAVHVVESGSHKLLIGAQDWGSDIASVRSECGSGAQVLVSAAGWPSQDSLRAYEIQGREATAVSAPSAFNGTITAMWPDSNASSAVVIVRKPQESGYEAYRVSIACSH